MGIPFSKHIPTTCLSLHLLTVLCESLLTIGAHAQEGYCSRPVCVSVCLSVKSHHTSGASVRPENTVTYIHSFLFCVVLFCFVGFVLYRLCMLS